MISGKFSKDDRDRLRKLKAHLDSIPTKLPPASVAFAHIPDTISLKHLDKMPTKLPSAEKFFENVPTKLKWVDEIRTS